MKNIIIFTHSKLAYGFKEAATFLAGENNIYILCAYSDELYPEKKLEQLLLSFDEKDLTFVFTDLKGGSVNHIATRLLCQYNFHLITGLNLGLLLEVLLLEEDVISVDRIRSIILSAREDMVYMNDLFESLNQKSEIDEEGFFN